MIKLIISFFRINIKIALKWLEIVGKECLFVGGIHFSSNGIGEFMIKECEKLNKRRENKALVKQFLKSINGSTDMILLEQLLKVLKENGGLNKHKKLELNADKFFKLCKLEEKQFTKITSLGVELKCLKTTRFKKAEIFTLLQDDIAAEEEEESEEAMMLMLQDVFNAMKSTGLWTKNHVLIADKEVVRKNMFAHATEFEKVVKFGKDTECLEEYRAGGKSHLLLINETVSLKKLDKRCNALLNDLLKFMIKFNDVDEDGYFFMKESACLECLAIDMRTLEKVVNLGIEKKKLKWNRDGKVNTIVMLQKKKLKNNLISIFKF